MRQGALSLVHAEDRAASLSELHLVEAYVFSLFSSGSIYDQLATSCPCAFRPLPFPPVASVSPGPEVEVGDIDNLNDLSAEKPMRGISAYAWPASQGDVDQAMEIECVEVRRLALGS